MFSCTQFLLVYVILPMTSRQRSRLEVHPSDNVDIWWTDLNFVATENSFFFHFWRCQTRVIGGLWMNNTFTTLQLPAHGSALRDPRYRLAEGYLPIFTRKSKIEDWLRSQSWRLIESSSDGCNHQFLGSSSSSAFRDDSGLVSPCVFLVLIQYQFVIL